VEAYNEAESNIKSPRKTRNGEHEEGKGEGKVGKGNEICGVDATKSCEVASRVAEGTRYNVTFPMILERRRGAETRPSSSHERPEGN
jgi:hypothetical protein